MELITFFIYVIAGGYGILLLMMIWAEWYWEQEFPQLKPVKRRGNRRYYQRPDVILIRQIRSLLYEDGFTIGGARQQLSGDEIKSDSSLSKQIIKQMREELEDVLVLLKS